MPEQYYTGKRSLLRVEYTIFLKGCDPNRVIKTYDIENDAQVTEPLQKMCSEGVFDVYPDNVIRWYPPHSIKYVSYKISKKPL